MAGRSDAAMLAAAGLLLASLAVGPVVAAQAPFSVEVRSLEAEAATLQGQAFALDLRAPADDPLAARLRLDAVELVIENDYANSTYAAGLPFTFDDHGANRHPLGPARLEATSTSGAGIVHVLVVPLEGPLAFAATSTSATGKATAANPRMDNVVPYSPHAMVEAEAGGSIEWILRGGTLVIDGSFQLVVWGLDVGAGTDAAWSLLPTGERMTPAMPGTADAVGTLFSQQVHAFAWDAHLEIDLGGAGEAAAYLGPSEVAWTGAAALLDARGDLPQVDGLTTRGPDGADAALSEGRLSAGLPRAGFIPVDVRLGAAAAPQPATAAGLQLPGGDAGWAAVPLLVLAVLVPGATLPWLRRRHGRRLAEVERALEEGRLSAAAEGARRLAGSRWFHVDAAVLGAEACLQAGDPRQALAFLDGRPWKPSAQGLRLLVRARAQALQGEMVAARHALEAALGQAPDLGAMARRDPLLQGLLDGPRPEGYS